MQTRRQNCNGTGFEMFYYFFQDRYQSEDFFYKYFSSLFPLQNFAYLMSIHLVHPDIKIFIL